MEKRNIAEVLTECKDNQFVNNAKAIREIALEEKVDVGVALDMYCAERKIKYPTAETREFLNLCREFTLNAIVKEI